MSAPAGRRTSPRAAAIAVLSALLLLASGASTSLVSGQSATGMMEMRHGRGAAASTPAPADAQVERPPDGDPLDGDPLDGAPPGEDRDAPDDQTLLDVTRSGRPNGAPRSLAAYDGNAQTVWAPPDDAESSWLWLDLGKEQRVRAVRWLATGPGSIAVSVSRDRSRWREVDRVDAGRGWRGIELREDARYVRLELLSENDGTPPALAEVAIYGSERTTGASFEQKAGNKTKKASKQKRGRAERQEQRSASKRQNEDQRQPDESNGSETVDEAGSGRIRVSTEEGETRCKGKRARCEARKGEVSVEEDCEREGSCAIDIRADGGTAVCDASGGERSRAGKGEGKRGADGGECEAVANGGAVAIGDIDP